MFHARNHLSSYAKPKRSSKKNTHFNQKLTLEKKKEKVMKKICRPRKKGGVDWLRPKQKHNACATNSKPSKRSKTCKRIAPSNLKLETQLGGRGQTRRVGATTHSMIDASAERSLNKWTWATQAVLLACHEQAIWEWIYLCKSGYFMRLI